MNSGSNNSLPDTGEIFGDSNPFVRRMKQFFAGGGLFETYGVSYEDHLMSSDTSITNGGNLWDSLHGQQQHADEQEQELRRSIGDHSVAVKQTNEDSEEKERMRADMLRTAAAIETRKLDAKLDANPHIVSVALPKDLMAAANIDRVTVDKRHGSLYIRSPVSGQSLYMKLVPNALENTQRFIVKASSKGYPQDLVVHLATYLQKTAFAEIEKLYDKGQ